MDKMDLESYIEALLFMRGEGMTEEEIGRVCNASEEDVKAALESLAANLSGRGIRLQWNDGSVSLATAPEAAPLLEQFAKNESARELSRPAQETLAIILYRGPLSKSQIDYIRGVNSLFVLRNLSIRGLIEKITHPDARKGYLYRPTFELLSHLGVSKAEDLPEYEKVTAAINEFENE
jgi:segregation and condensation protein B